jgi:hypothetical protein
MALCAEWAAMQGGLFVSRDGVEKLARAIGARQPDDRSYVG